MKKLILSLLLAIASFNLTYALEVVVDEKVKCSIVSEKEATAAEKNAAQELQKYLLKITGQKVPIVSTIPTTGDIIVVGSTSFARKKLTDIDFDNLAKDEILIHSLNENILILAGDRPRGTIYAVYTFLEKNLNCGFWTPKFETIPKQKNLTLGKINYRYASPFEYRQACSESVNYDRQFAVKLKLNGRMWGPVIPKKLGGYFQMDMGHSLVNRFIKPKKYFKVHPEWYAYRKGDKKRHKTQLCTSDKEMLNTLAKEVMTYLEKNPHKRDFLSISFADNDKFCQCEKCTAIAKKYGANSALIINAANFIARKTAKKYPKLRILFQAYWASSRPPEGMTLEPNIVVCFALLNRNHGFPVSSTPHHNPYLRKWAKLSHGQVYSWDYYAFFGNFLLPMPNILPMESNIRTYQKLGVKGIFAQLPFGSVSEFLDLRTWLFAKLVWNPSLNEKELIGQFLTANYGKAAPYISKYIYMLDKAKKQAWIGVYGDKVGKWLNPEYIMKAEQLFAKAQKSVANDKATAKRVRKLTASLLMLKISRYDELKKAKEKAKLPVETRAQLIDKLEAVGKEFKCTCYKEWDSFANLIKKLRKSNKNNVTNK